MSHLDHARLAERSRDTSAADPPSDEHSYRIVATCAGDYGGRLKIIRNESAFDTWMNHERGFGGDGLSGDPAWMVELLGERACAALGMHALGPRERTLPDADEVNAALDALDGQLDPEDRTALRFYEPQGYNTVSDVEYAEVFAREGRLPVAHGTSEAAHDLHFHFLGVLLPAEVIRHKRAEGRALLAFRDWVAAEPSVAELAPALQQAVVAWAETVDDLTGGPQIALNPLVPVGISEKDEYPDNFRWWSVRRLAHDTPRAHLREIAASLGPAWSEALSRFEASGAAGSDYERPLALPRDAVEGGTQRCLNSVRAVFGDPPYFDAAG